MCRTLLIASLALGLALIIPAEARAGIVAPSGLAPGDKFRMVFVTNTVTDATSNSASYYDDIVSEEAEAAGLAKYKGKSVTWDAIVSTASTSAISRLPADDVPIYLPDGTLVTSGGTALWSVGVGPNSDLKHAIDEDATGTTIGVNGSHVLWTGTTLSGNYYAGNGLGESAPSMGTINVGVDWIDWTSGPPTNKSALYGFSSVLTVPEPVPEPGALTLTIVSVGVLSGGALLRRCRLAVVLRFGPYRAARTSLY